MALKAQAESIAAVGSHSVTANHESGAKIGKEELFPVVPMYWRGKLYRAQFSADRYVHSSGWSDWRVYLYSVREDDGTTYGPSATLTDAMRRAMNEAGTPLVLAWLDNATKTDDGWTYDASRARAFRHFIARKMTTNGPTEYNVGYARDALDMHGHELTADDRENLGAALRHLNAFVGVMENLS